LVTDAQAQFGVWDTMVSAVMKIWMLPDNFSKASITNLPSALFSVAICGI
jgi:hypothetical protein